MYIAWLGSGWQKLELASNTLNLYIQKICFVPLQVLYVLVFLIFLIVLHTVLVVQNAAPELFQRSI